MSLAKPRWKHRQHVKRVTGRTVETKFEKAPVFTGDQLKTWRQEVWTDTYFDGLGWWDKIGRKKKRRKGFKKYLVNEV